MAYHAIEYHYESNTTPKNMGVSKIRYRTLRNSPEHSSKAFTFNVTYKKYQENLYYSINGYEKYHDGNLVDVCFLSQEVADLMTENETIKPHFIDECNEPYHITYDEVVSLHQRARDIKKNY